MTRTQSNMMAISCIQLICFLAFLSIFAIPSADCSRLLYPKALFIFGDSLYDAGNNNYINTTTSFQANFRPYGESFFKYPTGRFSDGRLIPDFIAEYARLPLIPPYLKSGNHQSPYYYGLNFASGGAGALVEIYSGLVIDLKMQLNYFKNFASQLRSKQGEKAAKILLSNAVYLFSVGSNDYSFFQNSTVLKAYGPEQYVQLVIGNFTAVLEEIYKIGGRKFGLVNLAPLGCTPGSRAANNGDCREEITALAKLHNDLFYKKIKEMEENLKGFHYSLFDLFGVVIDAIFNDPSTLGVKEVKSACCGSGPFRGIYSCGGKRGVEEFELCDNVGEYLFFDSGHPTEVANRHVAELMWNGDEKLTGPHNLKSLFHLAV